MTRLTNDIRQALTTDILKHRFTADVDKLLSDQAEFARRVYEDIFDQSTRDRMNGLPEGWLSTRSSIAVQMGAYTNLHFDGYIRSGDVSRLKTRPKERVNPTELRMPANKCGGCAKQYDPSTLLYRQHEKLEHREKELIGDVDTAKRSIIVALNAVSTVKRLIETWPEIDQFAKKYNTDKPNLPAVPTNHLNDLLRLP